MRPISPQLPRLPELPTTPSGMGPEKPSSGGDLFAELLVGKAKEVNDMQHSADAAVHAMLTGEDVNQAEVLTAVQKADLAFRMMLQIRNKLVEAYREISQIQV